LQPTSQEGTIVGEVEEEVLPLIEDPEPFIRRALMLHLPLDQYAKVRNEGFFQNYANCVVIKYCYEKFSDNDTLITFQGIGIKSSFNIYQGFLALRDDSCKVCV
jgi:hypothetical protein